MNTNKLSNSTALALLNNFANVPMTADGKIRAFIKVTSNVDNELMALGVNISPKSPDQNIFTISFLPSSLGQITDIAGVSGVDIGSTVELLDTAQPSVVNPMVGSMINQNVSNINQTKSATPTTWTPAKKGIVALLVVGTIYAILKHNKIIK